MCKNGGFLIFPPFLQMSTGLTLLNFKVTRKNQLIFRTLDFFYEDHQGLNFLKFCLVFSSTFSEQLINCKEPTIGKINENVKIHTFDEINKIIKNKLEAHKKQLYKFKFESIKTGEEENVPEYEIYFQINSSTLKEMQGLAGNFKFNLENFLLIGLRFQKFLSFLDILKLKPINQQS